MTQAGQTVSKNLGPIEAAGGFIENADHTRRLSDMVRAVIACFQEVFQSVGALAASYAEFSVVSNYFSSTGVFGHFYGFLNRDDQGNLVFLKNCGSVATKMGSQIGFMVADIIDTTKLLISWNFIQWEKMKAGMEGIPGLDFVAKMGLTFVKNLMSLGASTLAIADSVLIVHNKAVKIEEERGEGVFSLLSKGKLKVSDLIDKKMAIGFLKNAFKIALISMLLFAINTHWTFPIVCLVYSAANIAGIILKLQQEKAKDAAAIEVVKQRCTDIPVFNTKVASS